MCAGDVASEAVADHDRVLRRDTEPAERGFEDASVRFSNADLA